MHSSTRRKRGTRRSSWASQGVTGMAVSAMVASGGDGGVRAGRIDEGESVRVEREGDAGVEGVEWQREGRSRATGGQPGRVEVVRARRAHALLPTGRRLKTVGRLASQLQ